MNMTEIRKMAKEKGVNSFGKTKADMVRAIQRAENNRDCFNRGESQACGQAGCAWRTDCK